MLLIEKYGLELVNEINPGGGNQAAFGGDLLEKLIAIVTGLIGNCGLSREAKANAINDPGLFQRAALRRRINADVGGSLRERDAIFDAMVAKGRGLPRTEALAIVDEVTRDRYTLG